MAEEEWNETLLSSKRSAQCFDTLQFRPHHFKGTCIIIPILTGGNHWQVAKLRCKSSCPKTAPTTQHCPLAPPGLTICAVISQRLCSEWAPRSRRATQHGPPDTHPCGHQDGAAQGMAVVGRALPGEMPVFFQKRPWQRQNAYPTPPHPTSDPARGLSGSG